MNTLEQHLGNLLCYISKVATSARMNTAYNRQSINQPGTSVAAMWLVDMLHNLFELGDALKSNDYDYAHNAINNLKDYWTVNESNVMSALSVNEDCAQWDIQEGLSLLEKIKQSLIEQRHLEADTLL